MPAIALAICGARLAVQGAARLALQVLLLLPWLHAVRLLQAGTVGGFFDGLQLPESRGLMQSTAFCSRTRMSCADG